MAISNEEFAQKVLAGESVRGDHVEGAVRLCGGKITQCDWSSCTFDSTVEVENVSISVVSSERDVTALDLTGCRIAGDLSLRNVTISAESQRPRRAGFSPENLGSQTPEDRTVWISLADANIGGNMDVADLKLVATTATVAGIHLRMGLHAPRMKVAGESFVRTYQLGDITNEFGLGDPSPWLSLLDFSRSVIERSFRLEGGFQHLKGHSAQINVDMQVALLPSEVDANKISLHSARVGGDLIVEPDFAYSEEQRNRGYKEAADRGQLPLPGICTSIRAERLRVGGDAAIGAPVVAEDDTLAPLALRGVNLRRATVGNQLSINGVELTSLIPIEVDGHHLSGFCLKQMEVENCILRKVFSSVHGPSDGDFGRLLDLREMQARRDIVIESISGDITATEFDTDNGAIQGVDLSAVSCRNLDIRWFCVEDRRDQDMGILDVYGERLQVIGDATLGAHGEGSPVPLMSFPDCFIARLVLDRPLPEGKIELKGSTIERWSMGAAPEGEDNETAPNYLAMLRCSPVLDIGQYVSIEQRLEALGHRSDADLLRRSMKRRQRREHFYGGGRRKRSIWPKHPGRWLVSILHDISLGYGTQVWRPAVLLVVLFTVSLFLSTNNYVSWYQISTAKLAELQGCGMPCDGRRADYALAKLDANREVLRDAAGLTVRNLVPIIDVGLSAHLEPVRGSGGEAWLQFLRIMGWIIWPVLLTGLLARLMPKRNQ